MEFTLKEKLMLATKYRKYTDNSDHSNKFNCESLVVLPDNDIAFKMAQLFTAKAQGKVNYLLKDSISSFYSDEIIQNSIQYSFASLVTGPVEVEGHRPAGDAPKLRNLHATDDLDQLLDRITVKEVIGENKRKKKD